MGNPPTQRIFPAVEAGDLDAIRGLLVTRAWLTSGMPVRGLSTGLRCSLR
jgi:hypothetical protein